MKKILITFLALCLLLSSLASAQESKLEFSHGEVIKKLDFWSKIKIRIDKMSPFTLAGEQRGCSQYPDESKTVTGSYLVSCSGKTSLINWYVINADGSWSYMGETNAPKSISYGGKWAYECYYCPDIVKECSSGQKGCISESWYWYCSDGKKVQKSCGVLTYCSQGSCVSGCTYDGECQGRYGVDYKCRSNSCVYVPPPVQPPVTPPTIPKPILINAGVDIDTNDNCILANVKIRNEGDNMPIANLIEMQPRPAGLQPLAVVGEQRICDPTHPENVHRTFQLYSNEEVNIPLEVCGLSPGAYDVYFMTRDKCWVAGNGNVRTDPFPYSYGIKNVKIEGITTNMTTLLILIGVIVVAIIALVIYKRRKR